ncbi:MAG: 2TM domain-containing protein [Cyanobacteria bacterium P01_C01_bin.120]
MNVSDSAAVLSPATASTSRSTSFSDTTYSSEAVQKILQRALELRTDGRFSTQQLREMAAELDISPETLSAAISDWNSQQSEAISRVPLARVSSRRQQWRTYALASVLMIGIDILTAGTLTWSIFPVLGWGLGLTCGKCDRP